MSRAILSLSLTVLAVACGGTTASDPSPPSPSPLPAPAPSPAVDHGFPPGTEGWAETVETSSPWPFFGSDGSGVVIAPRWVAPPHFGCATRIWVRTEPPRELAPGDGPRSVDGATIDEVCRRAGVVVSVVDEAGYDLANLFQGSCSGGFAFSTLRSSMAEVRFTAALRCEDFAASRSAAAAGPSRVRQRVTLRLVSAGPSAAVEVLAIEPAGEDALYAVTER